MTDPGDPTRTEDEGATLDMPVGLGGFVPGQVLGERYRVIEMLGRGGMGEVWHALDLRLRVEVALKTMRDDLFRSGRRLEMPRDETMAARSSQRAKTGRRGSRRRPTSRSRRSSPCRAQSSTPSSQVALMGFVFHHRVFLSSAMELKTKLLKHLGKHG